ncbi:MAG: hypothetical protein EDM73_05400, partial [Armatimonadetes bacterium]
MPVAGWSTADNISSRVRRCISDTATVQVRIFKALKNSGGATLSSHSYGYDAASQITSRTDDGVVTTFVYDAIGQLLS